MCKKSALLTILALTWTPLIVRGAATKRFMGPDAGSPPVLHKIPETNFIEESSVGATSDTLDGGFDSQRKLRIAVAYDSSGVDKEFQMELVRSAFVALRELDENDLEPEFIDVAKFKAEVKPSLATLANWIVTNRTSTLVCLLTSENLQDLTRHYDQLLVSSQRASFIPPLKVFTPRVVDNVQYPPSVSVFSLQMSQKALSIALLNRVEKVGIRTLIPVLDEESPYQLQMLSQFISSGAERLKLIKFTRPIFINDPRHLASFRDILNQYTGFSSQKLSEHDSVPKPSDPGSTIGVMMFATGGSHVAMEIAAEKKHMQIGWFSPNILEHEEWAYGTPTGESDTSTHKDSGRNSSSPLTSEDEEMSMTSTDSTEDPNLNSIEVRDGVNSSGAEPNPFYGLYTVNFVGSNGWDNPTRRRVLRELTAYTGASPRILSAILAYDSAWAAVTQVRKNLRFSTEGLTGEIGFDSNGFRRDGVYFGISAVPDLSSSAVTLLQPSTWILEDTISLMETLEGQFLIRDYQVATSSILTGQELKSLANQTKKEAGCMDHVMNIVTHDPFNQIPYNYYFKEANLPENLLIPNQHGFGINVLCIHDQDFGNNSLEAEEGDKFGNETLKTTLQIACTPGIRISDPIKCFRSHLKQRVRRSPGDMPDTQYQYSFGGTDPWNKAQNTKWSDPKDDSANSYYYQSPGYYQGQGKDAVTPSYSNRRADASLAAAAADPPTSPAPPAGTSSLPQLRQILKAAKPFVGSCIGSTTGCAMCVLVLGRLPLGAVPAACTGPCFVGTFGTCGGLLGRVFSETTVICTELFRQGLIDTETFVADAEFGRMMFHQFPETLQGYQLLATPLVELMKKSGSVTKLVSTFALPWAHHMKYLMGRTNEPSVPGLLIHTVGFPLCNIAGQIYTFYFTNFPSIPLSSSSLILTALLLLIITLIIKSISISSRNFGAKGSSTASALAQLYLILGRSQELVRHVFT